MFSMRHVIEFKTPLQINVNVNITQTQDERVAELEKQQDDWLQVLKQVLGKLKTVSEKVDSTNIS